MGKRRTILRPPAWFLLALSSSLVTACPSPSPSPSVEVESAACKALDIQGHRGHYGKLPPGNTLASFQSALDAGVHTLEGDLQITSDKQLVFAHDDRLTKMACRWTGSETNEVNLISQQWDCHGEIPGVQAPPSLSEVLGLDNHVGLSLELKRRGSAATSIYAQLLLREAQACNGCFSRRLIIQSFSAPALRAVKKIFADAESSIQIKPRFSLLGAPLQQAISNKRIIDIWSPKFTALSRRKIHEAHRAQLLVIPWTVNSTENMKRMVRLGVDGIITDEPDQLLVLKEKLEREYKCAEKK